MQVLVRYILFFVFLLQGVNVYSKVNPTLYNVSLPAAEQSQALVTAATDSFYNAHPMLSGKSVVVDISRAHGYSDKTSDFYLLLFLCMLLGLIRFSDRRYFQNLWKAFRNTTLSNRQLREQLESTALPNLLMNIFFTVCTGAYIYYVGLVTLPQHTVIISPALLILMLIGGIMTIYLAKFATIKFSGWAFHLEAITDQYLFNVFLINKILGITLLPFVLICAFAGHAIAQPAIILSFFVIGALIINRYIRSWGAFETFIKYGKFHFFMYLCASELLPLAVLMKLLVRGLLYY